MQRERSRATTARTCDSFGCDYIDLVGRICTLHLCVCSMQRDCILRVLSAISTQTVRQSKYWVPTHGKTVRDSVVFLLTPPLVRRHAWSILFDCVDGDGIFFVIVIPIRIHSWVDSAPSRGSQLLTT